jgi:hypothetical protein
MPWALGSLEQEPDCVLLSDPDLLAEEAGARGRYGSDLDCSEESGLVDSNRRYKCIIIKILRRIRDNPTQNALTYATCSLLTMQ